MKEMLQRELNKTSLLLSSEGEAYEESYELEMLLRNQPASFLPLHVMRIDEEIQLCYDVSARQSLKDCTESKKLSGEVIFRFFEALERLMKETEDYLLDMESVLLDFTHIYTRDGEFYFCYCPWKQLDVHTAFRQMLEELLGVLDYNDTEGVSMAYHLYQSACKGSFQIEEILKEHAKKTEKSVENTEKEQEFYFPEEEFAELKEPVLPESTQEKVDGKKPGFLYKVVKFFLKKEKTDEEEEIPKKEKRAYEVPYPSFACEIHEDCEYTQVLEAQDDSTVLLGDMPVGRWRLRPLSAGCEEFLIESDSFIVGKKKGAADGIIRRESVSRIHSRLYVKEGRLFISDANSTNGTFVNEEVVAPGEMVEIFAGDRILFADVGYECYNSL